MDANTILHGLRWFSRQCDSLSVLWSGGEPLLRHDLFDLSREVAKIGGHVGLVTNGNHFAKSVIDHILKDYVSLLVVSVDSGHEETHDRIRGKKGLLANITQGVKVILRNRSPKLKIGFNCVVTKHNDTHMGSVVEFAEELAVDFVRFIPVEHRHDLLPVPGALRDFALRAREYNGQLVIQLPNQFVDEAERYVRSEPSIDAPCYAVERFVHVNLDGEILPCYMGSKPLGRAPAAIAGISDTDTLKDLYPSFENALKPSRCKHCLVFNNWLNIADDMQDFA